MYRRSLALTLSLVLGGCGADVAATEEDDSLTDPIAAGTYRFRAISHNIAGGPINRGSPAALTSTFQQIERFAPDAVMLQEVCASQVDAFRARYPRWNMHFVALRTAHPNCGPAPQGQLLASRWRISDVTITPLGDPDGDKQFNLLCGDIALPDRGAHAVRACVVHLRAYATEEASEARRRQVRRIDAALRDRIQRRNQALVVGGDFNTTPHGPALDGMYRLANDGRFNGPGLFHESDQTDRTYFDTSKARCNETSCRTGQPTHGRSKLDYVFYSVNRARGRMSALAIASSTSDHKLLRAWADLSY